MMNICRRLLKKGAVAVTTAAKSTAEAWLQTSEKALANLSAQGPVSIAGAIGSAFTSSSPQSLAPAKPHTKHDAEEQCYSSLPAQGYAAEDDLYDEATRLLGARLSCPSQSMMSQAEERRLREALALTSTWCGDEHPATIAKMLPVARFYMWCTADDDKLKMAEYMWRCILAFTLSEKGEAHPDSIEAMRCLAHSLYHLGRWAECVRMAKRAKFLAAGAVTTTCEVRVTREWVTTDAQVKVAPAPTPAPTLAPAPASTGAFKPWPRQLQPWPVPTHHAASCMGSVGDDYCTADSAVEVTSWWGSTERHVL